MTAPVVPVMQPLRVALSPTFLQGPWGTAWNQAHANVEEGILTNARNAVKMSFPGQAAALGASDALTLIGTELNLPRMPSEAPDSGGPNDISYSQRLLNAYTTWQYAGTSTGVLAALAALEAYDSETLLRNRDWLYLDITQGATGTLAVTDNAANTHNVTAVIASSSTVTITVDDYAPFTATYATTTGYTPINITLPDGLITLSFSATPTGTFTVAWEPNPPDGNQSLWARAWLVLGETVTIGSWTSYNSENIAALGTPVSYSSAWHTTAPAANTLLSITTSGGEVNYWFATTVTGVTASTSAPAGLSAYPPVSPVVDGGVTWTIADLWTPNETFGGIAPLPQVAALEAPVSLWSAGHVQTVGAWLDEGYDGENAVPAPPTTWLEENVSFIDGELTACFPWAANTFFQAGVYVVSAGNAYLCTTHGITAGGPMATSGTINDGTAQWNYESTPAPYAFSTVYAAKASITVGPNTWISVAGLTSGSSSTVLAELGAIAPAATVTDNGGTWTLVSNWMADTAYTSSPANYVLGLTGNVYVCATSGHSAILSGTGSSITDGSATWEFQGEQDLFWRFPTVPVQVT